jgi:hypothetical protein
MRFGLNFGGCRILEVTSLPTDAVKYTNLGNKFERIVDNGEYATQLAWSQRHGFTLSTVDLRPNERIIGVDSVSTGIIVGTSLTAFGEYRNGTLVSSHAGPAFITSNTPEEEIAACASRACSSETTSAVCWNIANGGLVVAAAGVVWSMVHRH